MDISKIDLGKNGIVSFKDATARQLISSLESSKASNESVQTLVNNILSSIPNRVSQLINDGNSESPFATENYVEENGGKINSISVNGVTQIIGTNKNIDISMPNKLTDLTNDGNFVQDNNYIHTDNNYTTGEKTKLSGIASGAQANIIETIKVNNSALTPSNKIINIDLSSYSLINETGAMIVLEMDSGTFKITAKLKDKNGNVISTSSPIDLPLESVVVNGSYDSTNQKIILTLENNNTIDIPVGALIAGLQTEITSQNKLNADLIDDITSANKFVSATEKNNWNAKYDKPASGIPSSDLAESYYLANNPNGFTKVESSNTNGNIKVNNNEITVYTLPNDVARTSNIPDELADLTDDSTHRLVTDLEKSTWSGKQDALPTTTTAGQVLKSTTTSGSTQWGTLSSSDVGALADSTKYGASLDVSGTSLQLKDQDGNNLGSAVTTQDTGATSVGLHTGDTGNVITDMSYDGTSRKITFEKGITALTSHQSIKKLDTTATTAQSTSASEDIAGSGTITLHKVSKTGSFRDLLDQPTLGTAAALDTGTASGNVPVLDSNGKLSTNILPALAITDSFVVSSQAGMLALTAEVGDVCIRTDLSKSFILQAEPASTLANWKELLTPADSVSSVNGQTGVVTGLEETSNKVTSINSNSTDTQYPSAKCVYDALGDKVSDVKLGTTSVVSSNVATIPVTTLNTKNIDATPIQNSTALVESGGVYTGLLAKENSSNKVTSLSSSSTDIQYPSAKAVYDAIASSGIIQLTGTSANPINLATNLVVGQMYSLIGYITLSSTVNYNLNSQLLVFKRSSVLIHVFYGRIGTSTVDLYASTIGQTQINSSTGYVTSSSTYGTISSFNGEGWNAVSFYAPTNAGTSGYILQSNGVNTAPTYALQKVTSVSNSSTDTQIPTAKAVYDYIDSLNATGVSY